jgi:ArsR family transcriptional regulator
MGDESRLSYNELEERSAMQDKLQSQKCAQFLKALADPDRLKIIQCLQTGPKNVGEIAALLEANLANVSHHLGVLRHAGLVNDEKQGKFVVYSLDAEVLQAKDVLELGCCRIELGKK